MLYRRDADLSDVSLTSTADFFGAGPDRILTDKEKFFCDSRPSKLLQRGGVDKF